mgnify:CR=1 FL=1|jgi:hypothetical protein
MKEITKILPLNEAAKLQTAAGEYDCTITELAVMGGGKARIAISGTEENLELLFSSIGNEDKETATV